MLLIEVFSKTHTDSILLALQQWRWSYAYVLAFVWANSVLYGPLVRFSSRLCQEIVCHGSRSYRLVFAELDYCSGLARTLRLRRQVIFKQSSFCVSNLHFR